MTNALEAEDVTKRFTVRGIPRTVVDHVTLGIPAGSIYCLLGPNGSGKTTFLKIAAGVLLPDSGTVRVHAGARTTAALAVRADIGVVFENAATHYGYLTVEDNLRYFGHLNRVPRRQLSQRVDEALRELDLEPFRRMPASVLSRGNQQKLAIANALVRDPSLLLLDEPTLGLDVFLAARLKQFLRRLVNEFGKTVVLTTHHLEIAEALGDAFGFLRAGRLLWQGSTHDLRRSNMVERTFVVTATGEPDRLACLAKSASGLEVAVTNGAASVTCAEDALSGTLARLASEGMAVWSVEKKETSLEEVFVRLVGGSA